MSRVAIVTDSASDLTAAAAAAGGITVVPLEVTFGNERFKAGVNLTTEEFWQRMTAPDAPFPKTAAASAGDFQAVFEGAFAAGAEAIVHISVAGILSAAIKSAEIARDDAAQREIHIVDSGSASMGEGILAQMASEMAPPGDRRPTSRRPRRPRGGPRPVRRPRDARVPQAGRPDQRRPGGDRDAAVGQADHHDQGRRGRDGRQAANAIPGPRDGSSSF